MDPQTSLWGARLTGPDVTVLATGTGRGSETAIMAVQMRLKRFKS